MIQVKAIFGQAAIRYTDAVQMLRGFQSGEVITVRRPTGAHSPLWGCECHADTLSKCIRAEGLAHGLNFFEYSFGIVNRTILPPVSSYPHHGRGGGGQAVAPQMYGAARPSEIRIFPTSSPLDRNIPQLRP